jgi:hypothetical protein
MAARQFFVRDDSPNGICYKSVCPMIFEWSAGKKRQHADIFNKYVLCMFSAICCILYK